MKAKKDLPPAGALEACRLLVENMPDGVALIQDGKIRHANEALAAMLGCTPEEAVGLEFIKLLVPGDKKAASDLKRMIAGTVQAPQNFECRLMRIPGRSVVSVHVSVKPGSYQGKHALTATIKDISSLKSVLSALSDSRNALLTVLDSIDATVYVADLKTHEILFANRVMKDVFGPDLEGQICYMVFRGKSGPCPHCSNDRLVDARGRPTGAYTWEGFNPIAKRWYMNYDRAIPWVTGQLVRLQVATDITERKKAETAVLENEERYRNLFEDSRDAIVVTDGEGFFLDLNRAALDLFGYSEEEMRSKNFREFYADPDAASRFQRDIDEKGSLRDYEVKLVTKEGTEMDCLLSVTAKRASDGSILRYQGIIRDITEHKRMQGALLESERRYKELSITDDLTGLYNVRHFYSQIKFEADRANRYHRPLSLLMMDLDNFKDYNDRYGHLEGDKALAAWGAVLRNNTRRTDSAYRYGGEEFTLILPETPAKNALVIAERLRMKLKTHVLSPVEGEKAQVTVSIGISEYAPGEEIAEFIKRADKGLYKAKEQGKDQTCSL
jgi:diguanylate cyclase (GGDEF)-like protein/PAS domain S-box-containing protein